MQAEHEGKNQRRDDAAAKRWSWQRQSGSCCGSVFWRLVAPCGAPTHAAQANSRHEISRVGRVARMAKKAAHVSETPATQWLRQHGIAFTEHAYDYIEHGGTAESARQLGVPEHNVVKTLVMQDELARPLVVLMHGDRSVSLKALAREIGCKRVEPCRPDVAQRHSGYLIGGTAPFALRKTMPVFVEASVLGLARICINGGRRGYLVGIAPEVLVTALGARAVHCASAE